MSNGYSVERWQEVYPPNPAMLRLQMVNAGYTVFQWSEAPNQLVGSHKHSVRTSRWVISGNLEVVVERIGRYVLGPGDRDEMPPEIYHTSRVLGGAPVIYLLGEIKPAVSAAEPKPTKSGKPRKKRKTKADKAAEDAQFEAIKQMFENF
jgi:hypothetical protein